MNLHTCTHVRVQRLPTEVILSRNLKENRGWQGRGCGGGCPRQRQEAAGQREHYLFSECEAVPFTQNKK